MIVRILGIIRKGRDTTRFLVLDNNNEYKSVLLPTKEYPKVIEIAAEELQACDSKWIDNFNVWNKKKTRLLNYLTEYKRNKLHNDENGYWETKDGDKRFYGYILPDDAILLNLIDSSYKDSMERTYLKHESDIHRGFKNLNSSQAFAFNFFQPIIDESLFSVLLRSYGYNKDSQITKSDYEDKNKEDDTQLDFLLMTDKQSYSFEVKYTEDHFGSAEEDSSHNRKWINYYQKKFKSAFPDFDLDEKAFFSDYQIWRNILLTGQENHHTCFLFPKFRNDLTNEIETVIDKFHLNKSFIHIIYVDTFVDEIINGNYNDDLKKHYSEFKEKYLNCE